MEQLIEKRGIDLTQCPAYQADSYECCAIKHEFLCSMVNSGKFIKQPVTHLDGHTEYINTHTALESTTIYYCKDSYATWRTQAVESSEVGKTLEDPTITPRSRRLLASIHPHTIAQMIPADCPIRGSDHENLGC